MAVRDIVTIGGSLGSTAPLRQIVAALPADLPAAIFVVTHLPSTGNSHLSELLSAHCALPVCRAQDGQPIEPGRVYCAVPDHHLLTLDHVIVLGSGPRADRRHAILPRPGRVPPDRDPGSCPS